MPVDHTGEALHENMDNRNCMTRIKMDDLWECLLGESVCCRNMISYGSSRYCVHKNHIEFGAGDKLPIDGNKI